jgi:hypothetical protein
MVPENSNTPWRKSAAVKGNGFEGQAFLERAANLAW